MYSLLRARCLCVLSWLFVVSGLLPAAAADVSINAGVLSGGYTQSFDTLPSTGSVTWSDGTTLTGWHAVNSAGTTYSSTVSALDGTSNMADLILGSLGTAGSGERALAYQTKLNTAPTYIGLAFNNNSGSALASFTLAYTAEQWREVNSSGRNLTFTVQYRVGATLADLSSTTGWTTLASLAATTVGGSVGASSALSSGTVPVSVPDGTSLWFRWITSNSATATNTANDILAIDNAQVTFTAAAGNSAPAITTEPADLTVSAGETATFTAVASGNPAPTYQWRLDTVDLPGETSASLVLTNVQASQTGGGYSVVATNSVSSATSRTAVLTVSASAVAPQITTQPASLTANVGGTASFSVAASGTAPLSYQWFHDTVLLPGKTFATLALTGLVAGDAGAYTVTVTNSVGSVPSDAATLTLNYPPAIITPPAPQSAALGGAASFSVSVSGAAPFTYQWLKNGSPISGATSAGLSFASVVIGDAAAYSVLVTNAIGNTTSAAASLTVTAPPQIVLQPQAQTVLLGGNLALTVSAVGSGPFTYQWYHDNVAVSGANAAAYTLAAAGFPAAGSYYVNVGNSYGAIDSASVIITVAPGLPDSAFNLTGFGAGTTGGGVIADTDAAYRKCYTPYEFAKAIYDSSKTVGAVRVIEIMNDLDLGYLEVDAATRLLGNFREHATAKLHPRLIVTGVSLIDTSPKNGGLTIFSANGSTLRHTCLNIKGTSNVIVRNLRFDEMWEWDEASKGDYDSNDWDFIDLSNGGVVTNVWIDHCTFTKAYDGIVDLKKGSQNVTFSWCRYVGDDGATNPNSFVRQQIAALEANKSSYTFYNFLRTNGFSVEDIVKIIQGHDKCHLMGATELDAQNDVLSATFHHQWFENIWDRCVPRLRGGQVHNYNIYVDDSVALVAKRLRDTRKAAMGTSAQLSLENTYSFNPFLNGSISTEGGAILVEKSVYIDCITPLRNNQTDPANSTYTGKIKAIDSIYQFHNNNGTTTTVRGDSTDAGNPMGPFQAAVLIPFSWNTGDGLAPYTAPLMDDPAGLRQILEVGAGAGRLTWDKSNWLKTTYPATLATFPVQPGSRGISPGEATTFAPVVIGSAPLTYQWFKDDMPLSGKTALTLTIASAVAGDAGSYTLAVTNSAGTATSAPAVLTVGTPVPTFATWVAAKGLSGGAAAATADPDGDALPNLVEYAFGLDPTIADGADMSLRLSSSGAGQWTVRYPQNRQMTGVTAVVESSPDLVTWTALPGTPVVESSTSTQDQLALVFTSAAPRLFVRLRVSQP
jgi:pectate lyase